MSVDDDATSEDGVLDGRLKLRQPLRGHRFGHDAILLAAATGARAGELAVDLGAGVGAAGLALAARVADLSIGLVEIDPMLCRLAEGNARLNRFDDRVTVFEADVEKSQALAAAGLSPGCAERVLMNPPFNDAARQNVSPDPRRRLAHAGETGLLPRWVAAAAWLLKPGGTLTLIWRAESLPDVIAALEGEFGGIAVLQVLPRPGAAPIRVLVRAAKGLQAGASDSRAAACPSLVLNDGQGQPTDAAQAVLRRGEALGIAN